MQFIIVYFISIERNIRVNKSANFLKVLLFIAMCILCTYNIFKTTNELYNYFYLINNHQIKSFNCLSIEYLFKSTNI